MRLSRNESELRIIAGKWRGRKIIFANNKDLRPTPDRVRETLFNWLAPNIKEARILDLFAGSGILSFESLSRGAASAVAVEKDKNVCAYINNNAERLSAENLRTVNKDAMHYDDATQQFDIIFLDPPYKSNLLLNCINHIITNKMLNTNGFIYFEWNNEVNLTELPNGLTIIKAKKAGQVYYYLAQKTT